MLRIKNVYPANLKMKEKKIWTNNYYYKSEAFIFSDKKECLFELKKYVENILSVDIDQCAYMIIKLNYDDISVHDKNFFIDYKKIRGGIIFKSLLSDICNKWNMLFYNWGESNRIQLFIPKNNNMVLFNKLQCIANHYLIDYASYMSVISECKCIISDTGDGEEFELIRKMSD